MCPTPSSGWLHRLQCMCVLSIPDPPLLPSPPFPPGTVHGPRDGLSFHGPWWEVRTAPKGVDTCRDTGMAVAWKAPARCIGTLARRNEGKGRRWRVRERRGTEPCRHGKEGRSACCGEGDRRADEGVASTNVAQRTWRNCARCVGLEGIADALDDNLIAVGASAALLGASATLGSAGATAQLAKAFVAVAFALVAVPAFVELVDDLLGCNVNIHVLMTLGAFASLLLGNASEGALLLVLFSGSHVAEHKLTERAARDASELQKLSPEVALRVRGETEETVRVQDVQVGDVVLVRAGELAPLDGRVVRGECLATMEHLTGEASPFHVQEGDLVPAGSIALDGRLLVEVTARADASTLERIGTMTMESIRSRPKLKMWLDDFGDVYSKLVLVAALTLMVMGPLVLGWKYLPYNGVPGSIHRSLGLMVAAAPCSLSVTPLAYIAAISSLARRGVILRSSRVLDALLSCDTIAFDKTGTLTTGALKLNSIKQWGGNGSNRNGAGQAEAVAIAGAVEQYAVHPIAQALVAYAREAEGLPKVEVDAFSSEPGQGLVAQVVVNNRAREVKIGRVEFILRNLEPEQAKTVEQEVEQIKKKATAMAVMSVDGEVTLFSFQDRVRPQAQDVIRALKSYFKKVAMLTGDRRVNADSVAKEVGIGEVHAEMTPEAKLEYVRNVVGNNGSPDGKQSSGLAMVGEGMNDAPALAASTVGIVLADRASAASMVAGDVILLGDAVESLPLLLSKARQTRRVVSQGVFFALFFILAASIPAVMGTIPLWLTVIIHEGGTLAVCMNALRTLNNPVERAGTTVATKSSGEVPRAPALASGAVPA
eukprot:scaffold2846_cov322-Pavlova_lutheri.AAC.31